MTTPEDRAEWERELYVPSGFAATRPSSDAQPRSGVGTSPSTPEAPAGGYGARCGFTVFDSDGNPEPCDRPATGHRWYQGHHHEDMLDVACDRHENEGGRRLHAAEAEVERLQDNLSALLCDLTGGRLSKTTYDVPTMVQAVEEYFDEQLTFDLNNAGHMWKSAVARAEAAEAERDRLREAVEALADEWEQRKRQAEKWAEKWATTDDGGDRAQCEEEAENYDYFARGLRAALASVGVSGSADDRREANAAQAPDTATPGEATCVCGSPDAYSLNPAEVVTHRTDGPCTIGPAASSVDDKEGE